MQSAVPTSLPLGGPRRPAPVPIQAVVFDLGGTLEEIYYDGEVRREAVRGIQAMLQRQSLDPGLSLPTLEAAIEAGLAAYQRWRQETDLELPPERVWTEFVFAGGAGPPLPRDRLTAVAEDLAFFYENHAYLRRLRPEAPQVLEILRGRGSRLGIISNVTSRRQVRGNLTAYGLISYFGCIVTSVEMGIRKPHPRLFHEAARQLDCAPDACAYVGDTVSRDIRGARRAGYGLAVLIRSFLTGRSDGPGDTELPDAVITDLRECIGILDRRNRRP